MILRFQTEEEVQLLQSKIKAKSITVHVSPSAVGEGNLPRKRHPRKKTFEQMLLARQLIQAKIAFQEEFRFHPKRRWCFDFLVGKFGVEIVGGLWLKRGGHSQGQAQLDDMEKFNHALLMGYGVLQFSPAQVKSGEAVEFIEKVLAI